MSAHVNDPIIRDVRERMARAAVLADKANAELEAAVRRIRAHPDFKARRHEGESASLPWWYGECLRSVLEDGPLGDAAGWLRDDLRGARSTLRQFIRDEETTLARRAAA